MASCLIAVRPGDRLRARRSVPTASKACPSADAGGGGRLAVPVARPRHGLLRRRGHRPATLAGARRRRFHGSPIRIGDRIFGCVAKGEVIVLAADRRFKLLARNSLGEPAPATPAVANDRLYVRTESSLVCIGEPAMRTMKTRKEVERRSRRSRSPPLLLVTS